MTSRLVTCARLSALACLMPAIVAAQRGPALGAMEQARLGNPATTDAPAGESAAGGIAPSPDYVIGPEDVLTVVFWNEKDLSADAVVRPDGKISLPLLGDVVAAGLTPKQLRDKLTEEAQRFVEDAMATVIVKQINSPKVFITGEVIRPGSYPLNAPTTVLQLIATAGGLQEYAKSKEISILRLDAGRTLFFRFNYKDVMKQRNVDQNIKLQPGDTVVIP